MTEREQKLVEFIEFQDSMISMLIEHLDAANLIDEMDRITFNGWSQEYQKIMELVAHGEQARADEQQVQKP